MANKYQNDTSIVDGRNIFGPEVSLVNIDEIWTTSENFQLPHTASTEINMTGASSIVSALTSPENLAYRAKALVATGAAVNIEGAEKILNVTIDLVVNKRRTSAPTRWNRWSADRLQCQLQNSSPKHTQQYSTLRFGHSCLCPEVTYI
jgi:DNA polymerase IIIc chi subunit